jgi:hypothetical protein
MPSLPPHTDSCWRRRYLYVRYESHSTYNMIVIMMDIECSSSRYFLRVKVKDPLTNKCNTLFYLDSATLLRMWDAH